jgi:hypothetical protein
MVEARLYFRESVLNLECTMILGGLGSSGCVVLVTSIALHVCWRP